LERDAGVADAEPPEAERLARVADAEHVVQNLEHPEARASADVAEDVTGEQRGHGFLDAERIPRVEHEAARARRVEAPDEPREGLHAAADHRLEVAELALGARIVAQPR